MSMLLEKAREQERQALEKKEERLRPVFHFSNPTGWMNDPNGFSEYKGEHHLFYQYYPYATHWDSMHWGHAKSSDFIRWEYLPAALAPDEEYDSFGVFSGSALTEGEKQILMYTGVRELILENGEKKIFQNQCIAVGDGTDYVKCENNPVITSSLLPEGSSREDFRDPKLWKEDDRYFVVAGSRHKDGSGQIALFYSDDLEQWKLGSILDRSENKLGKMWECPDFFPLGDKQVLLISPQEMEADGLEFHGGNNTAFLTGTYEKQTMKFTREQVQCVDYGLDFYAPQTMLSDDGRRVMIGWMQSWDNPMYPPEQAWSGMMTVPRELIWKDGYVYQKPVRELEKYRRNAVNYPVVYVEKETALPGVSGRSTELLIKFTGKEYTKCRMKMAAENGYYSELVYDREDGILTFDRSHSGIRRDCICTRSLKLREKDKDLSLRILIDRYSIEIFVNEGEQVMTSLVYTPVSAEGITFSSNGRLCMDITKYDIEVE